MVEYVAGADVGGTKTLIALAALERGMPRVVRSMRYANADFPDFYALARRFIADAASDIRIDRVCLGLAGPLEADAVKLTNRDWTIERLRVGEVFSGAAVRLANDFEVAAYGIDLLAPEERLVLQAGAPLSRAPQVVIGAGTGLGVAFRVWADDHYRVIPGEGGHVGFAPIDLRLAQIWQTVYAEHGRVGNEMLISGAGIARLYKILSAQQVEPAEVTRRAMVEKDPHAIEALQLFARCYGAAAGDHALSILARGGVFLIGGVTQRTREFLQASDLLKAFNAKGHHAPVAQRMPVYLVLNEQVGLLGALLMAARG